VRAPKSSLGGPNRLGQALAVRDLLQKNRFEIELGNTSLGARHRWPCRIRSAGVDSGRILRFFGSGSGVKFCEKPDPDPDSLFIFGSGRSRRGLYKCSCLSSSIAEFRLHRRLPECEQESDSQI